ncbi:MAG: hypothetical protein Faunusvirus1_47 [Faunusvirus sp.]|jgi:hypothetical protein|uniref:Uncharacterized protein n=1 Tax=Faunusvirus sp. TaxID=2487766 RepID=A0A3G4ZVW0_9VIRU|nr:MAG: hypothetical protein Faunusvirus1_47 [Faunusvirus sp.]
MGQTTTKVSKIDIKPVESHPVSVAQSSADKIDESEKSCKSEQSDDDDVGVYTYLGDSKDTKVELLRMSASLMTIHSEVYKARIALRETMGLTGTPHIQIGKSMIGDALDGLTDEDLDDVNLLFTRVLQGDCINHRLFCLKYKQCVLIWLLKGWLKIKSQDTLCCTKCDNILKDIHFGKPNKSEQKKLKTLKSKKLVTSLSCVPENKPIKLGYLNVTALKTYNSSV